MEKRSKKKAAKCLRETEVRKNYVSSTLNVIYYLFKVSDLVNVDCEMNKKWFGTEIEKAIARRIIWLIN